MSTRSSSHHRPRCPVVPRDELDLRRRTASTATRTPCSARTRTTAGSPSGCSSRWPAPSVVRHGDGTATPLDPRARGRLGRRRSPAPTSRTTGSRSTYDDGHAHTVDDPYRFLPTLGEMDLHLINEGRHEQLWEVLGARVHHYDAPLGDPISGTSFAVWAPRPAASGSRATSTAGTVASTRCASSASPASGSCSCPASAAAPATSSRSSAPTASGARRPTRWRRGPRCRPRTRPPRSSSRRYDVG